MFFGMVTLVYILTDMYYIIIYQYHAYDQTNVFKPNPETEPDDLPGHWVTGSTADEPWVNK